MAKIETEKMLRLGARFRKDKGNDKGMREHNLSHAVIKLPHDTEVEAFGKFDEFGNYIAYVLFTTDGCVRTFHIKTNPEQTHSAEAKNVVVIECNGFFLEKEYIEDINYNVMQYDSNKDADEKIYIHSAAIGTMLKEEGYHYNCNEQRFERNA